jgi:hypothetical protein
MNITTRLQRLEIMTQRDAAPAGIMRAIAQAKQAQGDTSPTPERMPLAAALRELIERLPN